MPRILLVTNKRKTLETLARALKAEASVALEWAHERAGALKQISDWCPDLVVVDEYVGYLTNFEFIRQIAAIDARVCTAAVSRLPRETFRDIAAGLGGVAQLPPGAGILEAERLLALLETAPRSREGLKPH
ncbi:MAG: hypothetical protein QNI89_14440 [Desulfobacterales bacterium]|nr:hypothetical protein [Desulfobacterales bacterium]MDJ0888504.1 hypothetical protein [Desulfobacterales bacterium]MDJ0988670.1 hypothetical protein [Desulfobacterales bacterium]